MVMHKGGRWRLNNGRFAKAATVKRHQRKVRAAAKKKSKVRKYEITAVARIRFKVHDPTRETEADAFIEVVQGGTVRSTPQGLKRHKARYRRQVVKALEKEMIKANVSFHLIDKEHHLRTGKIRLRDGLLSSYRRDVGIEHRRLRGKWKRKDLKVDVRRGKGPEPKKRKQKRRKRR